MSGRLLSLVLLALLAFGSASCAKNPKEAALESLRDDLVAVEHMQQGGVVDSISAVAITASLQKKASERFGQAVSVSELRNWRARVHFMSFLQIVSIIAGLMAFLGLAWLLRHVFTSMPGTVWELLVWGVSLWFLFAPPMHWLLFLGAIGIVGALQLTGALHNLKSSPATASAICMVLWGISAGVHHDGVLAIMTVLALESLVGFQVAVGGLCVAMGFETREETARATVGSLVLILAGVVLHQGWFVGPLAPTLNLFTQPLLFVGCFVYFLGLLILAAKWWTESENYWLMQVLMVVSALGMIFFSGNLDLPYVTGIAGTFFAVYLGEKYAELVIGRIHGALALIGAAGLLYGFVKFAEANPQYFLFRF